MPLTKTSFIEMYVRRAKLNFDVEIDIRRDTEQHNVAYTLGIPLDQVKELWDEVSDLSHQRG